MSNSTLQSSHTNSLIEPMKLQLKPNKSISVGQRFGRWTVLETLEKHRVKCLCDCGSVKEICRYSLTKTLSTTKSCGCLRKESTSKRFTTHGYSSRTSSERYLYTFHQNMKSRCQNPNKPEFKWYGGRGISIDPSWENPKIFVDYIIEHLGHKPTPNHSIDRINNNAGYVPGNLRWATQKEQMLNTSRSEKYKLICT